MVDIPNADVAKKLDDLAEKALKEYKGYRDAKTASTGGMQDMLDTGRKLTRYKNARQAIMDELVEHNYKEENDPPVPHLDYDEKVKRCADRWGMTVERAHKTLGSSADGRIEDAVGRLNAKGGHYYYDQDSANDIDIGQNR